MAIKMLPKDFVSDADRLRRFEQEAKTLVVGLLRFVRRRFPAFLHAFTPQLKQLLLPILLMLLLLLLLPAAPTPALALARTSVAP